MVLGTSLMQRSGDLAEYSGFFYSRIGHQQQLVDVSTFEFSGQLCECIRAEQHLCFLIETKHLLTQAAVQPPSILRLCPVTIAEASDAR